MTGRFNYESPFNAAKFSRRCGIGLRDSAG